MMKLLLVILLRNLLLISPIISWIKYLRRNLTWWWFALPRGSLIGIYFCWTRSTSIRWIRRFVWRRFILFTFLTSFLIILRIINFMRILSERLLVMLEVYVSTSSVSCWSFLLLFIITIVVCRKLLFFFSCRTCSSCSSSIWTWYIPTACSWYSSNSCPSIASSWRNIWSSSISFVWIGLSFLNFILISTATSWLLLSFFS